MSNLPTNDPNRVNPWTKVLSETKHADIARALSTEERETSSALVNAWAHGKHHPSHEMVLRILEVYKDISVTVFDIREHFHNHKQEVSNG